MSVKVSQYPALRTAGRGHVAQDHAETLALRRESGGGGGDAVRPTDAVVYPKGRAVAVQQVRNFKGLRGPFVCGTLDQPQQMSCRVVGIVEGQTEVRTDGRNESFVVCGLPLLLQQGAVASFQHRDAAGAVFLKAGRTLVPTMRTGPVVDGLPVQLKLKGGGGEGGGGVE